MVINLRKVLIGSGTVLVALLAVFLLTTTWSVTGEQDKEDQVSVSRPRPVDKLPKARYVRGFFSEYRMERERTRDAQIELLREMINNPNVDKKSRETASSRLVEISETIEREVKAETMIKARGYEDCVIMIQSALTTVVIPSKTNTLPVNKEEEIKKQVSQMVGCQPDEVCVIVHRQ